MANSCKFNRPPMSIQSSGEFRMICVMNGATSCLLLIVILLRWDCLGCPNHCFCYKWEGLFKTDCARRNLFNTFVGFSHQTQILDLSHNVISILHGNEFLDANLRQLQDLKLSNNRLYKIDKLSFNGLQELKNLDLSFNYIEYINPSTFKYNYNLKVLNISFNPLSLKKEEPFLSPVISLQVLDMANCHLEFLSPNLFSDFDHLNVLNVSRNYIRTVDVNFLYGMKNLNYLDLSKNDLPCNDQTKELLRFIEKRKVQFEDFCWPSQKLLTIPVKNSKETDDWETEVHRKHYNENTTEKISKERSTFDDVTQFLQSIPSLYAIVCGVQVGILIGSFLTYFCLRKSIKNHRNNAEQEDMPGERTGYGNGDSDNLHFALIPLNTPPGTPPSPYHSRFFPSSFSLSAT